MTCPDCQTAANEPHHVFHAACQGCKARAFSRGPAYHQARVSGRQDKLYRQILQQQGLTHEEVKRAAEADALQNSYA